MRKPTRQMPALPAKPLTWTGTLVLLIFGLGFVALVYSMPLLLVPIGAVALWTVDDNRANRSRLASMAAGREGESICSFARSFDCRAVDTWIIRATFEELRPYCRFGRRTLPLRATDDLDGDLRIDPEDLEEVVVDIAHRSGRSLDEAESNPLHGCVKTVADLVMFFASQPQRIA